MNVHWKHNKLTFLWMKLRFPDDGSVRINMQEYIMEAFEVFNHPLARSAATPVIRDLFDINDQSKPLSDEKMDSFVSAVMKLMWVGKHGQPDTKIAPHKTEYLFQLLVSIHTWWRCTAVCTPSKRGGL